MTINRLRFTIREDLAANCCLNFSKCAIAAAESAGLAIGHVGCDDGAALATAAPIAHP